ncbi:unnamed protein product, partial [Sphacelaria rigidula]
MPCSLVLTALLFWRFRSSQDLSALSYTSMLGVFGTLYTAVVMAIRYFDKSYVEGGRFFAGLAENARPFF